jgi:hypothetical protein
MKPDCDMTQDERELLAEVRRLRQIVRVQGPIQADLVAALKAMVQEEELSNPGADGHLLRTAKAAIARAEAD